MVEASTGIRGMRAKRRFRLRQRLTNALARVLSIVGEMEGRSVGPNRENLAAADTAMRVVAAFLKRDPATNVEPVQVLAEGKVAITRAVVRRLTETRRRNIRRARGDRA